MSAPLTPPREPPASIFVPRCPHRHDLVDTWHRRHPHAFAISDGLREVRYRQHGSIIKVGDRAGHPQYTMDTSERKIEPLRRALEQDPAVGVEITDAGEAARTQHGIATALPGKLPGTSGATPRSDPGAGFRQGRSCLRTRLQNRIKGGERERFTPHLNMDIDTIQKRGGYP